MVAVIACSCLVWLLNAIRVQRRERLERERIAHNHNAALDRAVVNLIESVSREPTRWRDVPRTDTVLLASRLPSIHHH